MARDLRSMPAQNAGSAPVSTMHPTSSRSSSSVIAASSWPWSSDEIALRDSGRFSVTVATRSSTSTSTSISGSSLHVAMPVRLSSSRHPSSSSTPGTRPSKVTTRSIAPVSSSEPKLQPSIALAPRSTRCQV